MTLRLSRFGPFLIDRTGYRVLRGDEPLDLSPKLLDLLVYLVDHREVLVTKEALLDALWTAANVTENALAQAISELRQVLEDDAQAPRYIKTVARRGYRFIAPVEEVAASNPAAPLARTLLSAVPSGIDAPGVAVMDFTNVTGDPSVAWLASGIAETVSGDLRALGRFRVIDRSRVIEAARHANGALPQLAAMVGTPLVVMGSYQQTSDRLRITARLVDVGRGEAIADAKIDGPIDRIFEMQDAVVGQLASALTAASHPGALVRTGTRETSNLEAYRALTEGWLKIESLDVRELEAAVDDLTRAIALDPRYALAHTGLASATYALFQDTRTDNEPNDALLREAITHARRAVDLDPGLAEAHATLSMALVDE